MIRPPAPLSKGAKISLAVPYRCHLLRLADPHWNSERQAADRPVATFRQRFHEHGSDSVFTNPEQFTADRLMWDSLWVTGDSAHVATRYGVSQASVLALKVRGEREGWPKPSGAVTQDAVR